MVFPSMLIPSNYQAIKTMSSIPDQAISFLSDAIQILWAVDDESRTHPQSENGGGYKEGDPIVEKLQHRVHVAEHNLLGCLVYEQVLPFQYFPNDVSAVEHRLDNRDDLLVIGIVVQSGVLK